MSQLSGVFDLDGLERFIRYAALALPVLVLLTLMAVFRSQAKAKKKSASGISKACDTGAAALLSTPAGVLPPQAAGATRPPTESQTIPAPDHNAATPSVIDALQRRLSEAKVSAPKSALAPLYLDLAQQHRDAGDETARLSALRSAAGLAAQHGPHAAHAKARLELAEAAYAAGDLTGACEQWQMARMALHEAGDRTAQAGVDKRMRDNGCPTDWVLTDF
jgi:hypothetical protein